MNARPDEQYLHGPQHTQVGVWHRPGEDDMVTLRLQHGKRFVLTAGQARSLAVQLDHKADLAGGGNDG